MLAALLTGSPASFRNVHHVCESTVGREKPNLTLEQEKKGKKYTKWREPWVRLHNIGIGAGILFLCHWIRKNFFLNFSDFSLFCSYLPFRKYSTLSPLVVITTHGSAGQRKLTKFVTVFIYGSLNGKNYINSVRLMHWLPLGQRSTPVLRPLTTMVWDVQISL